MWKQEKPFDKYYIDAECTGERIEEPQLTPKSTSSHSLLKGVIIEYNI